MQDSPFFLIELEISSCVVVGNVLYHLAQQLAIVGQQPLLHIVAKEVAEDAAEILVTRIAQERARVGQHTHKATQQTEHRQGVHLLDHAVHLVIEPPTATKLNLARLTTLEVAEHRGDDLVGAGIQRI